MMITDELRVPQADDLDKVFHVAELINLGYTSSAEIAEGMGVVERQGLYYACAAEIVGVVERDGDTFSLTRSGRDYVTAEDKTAVRRRLVFQTPIVRYVASALGIRRLRHPVPEVMTEVETLTPLLEELDFAHETAFRRAHTLRAWLKDL